ncbi:MAG: hypothetical protein ABSA09_04490, partial [Desulfobaccales bacterium]
GLPGVVIGATVPHEFLAFDFSCQWCGHHPAYLSLVAAGFSLRCYFLLNEANKNIFQIIAD